MIFFHRFCSEFILELLLKTRKVVVFAHHTLVLDTLCVALEAKVLSIYSVDRVMCK